jgi:trimeric autotransporter adhesin
MLSQIKNRNTTVRLFVAKKSSAVARGRLIMSPAAHRSASRVVSFAAALFAVAVVPLLAGPANVTLVPAISTITGNGAPGVPGASPTLASSSQDEGPIAITTDAAGNIYFADGEFNTVWKITRATGIMAIFAGIPGPSGQTGDGGPATLAKFRGPEGLKFDSLGNLYIIDTGNSTVRKVDTNGIITTVVGIPHSNGQTGDGGLATSAKLGGPSYLAFDGANNLYIADLVNNAIRRVDATTHIITTVAGDPTSARASGQTGDGGPATSALLNSPNGICVDRAGNLYIADRGNNVIRRVDAVTQNITTVAGDPTSARASGSTGDGGPATSALLNFPWSVEVDHNGNLFISDFLNNVVREVTINGHINTIAGTIGSAGFSGDGGAATSAHLSNPTDVAIDALGNVFITDLIGATVRAVNLQSSFPATAVGSTSASQNLILHVADTLTITGITVPASQGGVAEYAVGSLGGTGCSVGSPIVDGGSGTNCILPVTFQPSYPGLRSVPLVVTAVLPDPAPLIFTLGITGLGLGPQIGFTPALITTVAGNGTSGFSGDTGPATSAELSSPLGVVADFQGNLYISDSGNDVIRRVDGTTQHISTFAGTQGESGYGGDQGAATSAELTLPSGLALDSASNLYISDKGNSIIRKVATGSGIITTVAGTPQDAGFSGDGGLATNALLKNPVDQALDTAGNLYIADSFFNIIREVNASTRFIATDVGVEGSGGHSGDGGFAINALMSDPLAVVIDAAGNLYISDEVNSVIRKVTAGGGIITDLAGVAGAGAYGGDGGAATSAHLNGSEGLAVDAAGNLYITDSGNNLVRKVSAFTGDITTIAGTTVNVPDNVGYSGDNGAATAALLHHPMYPSIDSAGNLYVTDSSNNVIRKIAGVAPLSFGSVGIGASSSQQDVTITNNGTTALRLTGLTLPTDFNLSGADTTCTSTTSLAPAQSCVLGVVFAPTVIGALNETLTVVDNLGSQAITLGGTGVAGPTTTVLTAAPNPAISGHSVTLTATISPVPTGSPLGSVFFCENGTSEPTVAQFMPNARSAKPGSPPIITPEEAAPCGSGTLLGTVNVNSSGMAVLSIGSLPVGAHSITAVYSGNAALLASRSSAVIETVSAGATTTSTTTTLTASPNPAPAGQTVTLTATISPAPTGSSLGTVSFFRGATLLGTATVNSSGVATFTIASLPDGADAITAVYSGNTAFAASTSSAVTETITAAYAVTAPVTSFAAAQGSSVVVNVTVPPLGGSFNNVVTMSATGLPPGATATFNPPTVTPGATGAPTALTIQLLSASTAASRPADQQHKIPFAPFSTAVALGCIALGYRYSTRRIIKSALIFASFFLVATFLSACNGGLASKPGTLPGNYVITITGTSGALHRSTTITLTIQ